MKKDTFYNNTFEKKFNQTERNQFRALVLQEIKAMFEENGLETFDLKGKFGFHLENEQVGGLTENGAIPLTLEIKIARDYKEQDLELEQNDYYTDLKLKEDKAKEKAREKAEKMERDKKERERKRLEKLELEKGE